MKIVIEKPCYYEKNNDIDIEIVSMINKISTSFFEREYSENINSLTVIPVVAPVELLTKGMWKEGILLYSSRFGDISVVKHISFETYINGTVEDRKRLTIKCIIEAVELIKSKKGTKFDFNQFKEDLLTFCNYTEDELEQYGITSEKHTQFSLDNLKEKYTIRVNSSGPFKNRIVSKFLIKEVIDYVKKATDNGIDEFVVLTNIKAKNYIQCVFVGNSYLVQIPIEVQPGLYRLAEKRITKKSEVVKMFNDFIEGKDMSKEYFTMDDIMGGIKSFKLN